MTSVLIEPDKIISAEYSNSPCLKCEVKTGYSVRWRGSRIIPRRSPVQCIQLPSLLSHMHHTNIFHVSGASASMYPFTPFSPQSPRQGFTDVE